MTLPPLRDRNDPDWHRTAVHEAGHGVVAVVLGQPFTHVTLRPADTRWRGAVIGTQPRRRPLAAVSVYLGGCFAVVAAGLDDDATAAFCRGGGNDLANVLKFGDGLPLDSLLAVARRTWTIVSDTHEVAVHAVAEALLAHPEQRLSRAQVAGVVEDHQPGGLAWLIRHHEEALAEQTEQAHHAPGPTTTNTDPWSPATTQTVKPR